MNVLHALTLFLTGYVVASIVGLLTDSIEYRQLYRTYHQAYQRWCDERPEDNDLEHYSQFDDPQGAYLQDLDEWGNSKPTRPAPDALTESYQYIRHALRTLRYRLKDWFFHTRLATVVRYIRYTRWLHAYGLPLGTGCHVHDWFPHVVYDPADPTEPSDKAWVCFDCGLIHDPQDKAP